VSIGASANLGFYAAAAKRPKWQIAAAESAQGAWGREPPAAGAAGLRVFLRHDSEALPLLHSEALQRA
jgi:hypothetical protein